MDAVVSTGALVDAVKHFLQIMLALQVMVKVEQQQIKLEWSLKWKVLWQE